MSRSNRLLVRKIVNSKILRLLCVFIVLSLTITLPIWLFRHITQDYQNKIESKYKQEYQIQNQKIKQLEKVLDEEKQKNKELTTKLEAKIEASTFKTLSLKAKETIKNSICETFGNNCNQAVRIASCENSSFSMVRVGHNKNGSFDSGPFQINSVHQKRFGTAFTTDVFKNIKVAYQIYKEQGWRPWYSSNNCHQLAYGKK